MTVFKIARKVLGHICMKNCHKELKKSPIWSHRPRPNLLLQLVGQKYESELCFWKILVFIYSRNFRMLFNTFIFGKCIALNAKMSQYDAHEWTEIQLCSKNGCSKFGPITSSGLVVMGRDSFSKGHRFASQHSIIDWQFTHLFVAKMLLFVWQRLKINVKEDGTANF